MKNSHQKITMIMSSSTTRPSFTLFTTSSPSPPPPPPRLLFNLHPSFPPPLYRAKTLTAIKSIDVSKEDKPTPSENESPETDIDVPETEFGVRRVEEKFAVVNTGIYECRSCGYKYNESAGDPSYPVPPGLPFDKLPEDWRCPTCGASQNFFESKKMEIAGFEQNQQFGLGGNTLTSGQKLLLIYGGLLLGFALFLSGYFLQ